MTFHHRLLKAASTLAIILNFGLVTAHSHPLPKTETNSRQKQHVEDMKNRREAQRIKMETRRAEAEARRAELQIRAEQSRLRHRKKAAQRKAQHEIEKARQLDFKNQFLDMLIDDGVITSREESVNVIYINDHPIANGIDLQARFGDKYSKLWESFDHIMSNDSYMNITPHHYEIREITKHGRSRHYQISFNDR